MREAAGNIAACRFIAGVKEGLRWPYNLLHHRVRHHRRLIRLHAA